MHRIRERYVKILGLIINKIGLGNLTLTRHTKANKDKETAMNARTDRRRSQQNKHC